VGTDVPRLLTLRGRMDPLNQLWDLYESLLATDDEAPSATMGSPNEDNYEHPVTQERMKVDMARAAGADPTDAHEQIFGEVDTGDATQKASLAATLGRVQKDNNKRHIKIEREAEHPSILAQDEKMQKLDQVTPDDMRTPTEKEVPNALQQPDGATSGVTEEVDNTEEFDYNFDVAYLQKYGRA